MSEPSENRSDRRRNWLPYTVALVLLFALGLVSGILWFEIKERFPKLPDGVYVGSIQGIDLPDGLQLASLYLESKNQSQQMDILVLAPGFEVNQIKTVIRGENPELADWLLPITFDGAGLNFKLLGEELAADTFGGKIIEMQTAATGQWKLRKIDIDSSQSVQGNTSELALWLLLKSELNQVESRIAKAELLVPTQKAEIEKLRKFVNEGVALKEKGEQLYNQERTKFKQAVERLKSRQQEARELESRIELSQRLTPMGKLVSLARDSLDREGRWLETMLRSSADEKRPDLDSAFERGQEILQIRTAIDHEQQRISNLRTGIANAHQYSEEQQRHGR